jgi:hypothetical protein
VERAIEWHAAFETHRRALVDRRQAEFVTDEQQRLGVEYPEDRFDGIGVAPRFVIEPCLGEFLVNCFIFPIVALLVSELVVGAALVAHARICARLVGNGLYRDKWPEGAWRDPLGRDLGGRAANSGATEEMGMGIDETQISGIDN